MVMAQLFVIFMISFFLTNYLVPLIIEIAKNLKVMDNPDGKLKNHKYPIPYLGGVAIYLGFILSLFLSSFIFSLRINNNLILTGSILLLVGLIDDLFVLRPCQKFLGQIIATIYFLKSGYGLKLQFLSDLPNIVISFVWILSITNAFNLIDVMDGLATLVAFVAAFSFLVCALILNNSPIALMLAALMGVLACFLKYNRPQASIYLGDAGSLFVGGILSVVPCLLSWGVYNSFGILACLVILFIPLIELSTLVLVRFYKGIPFYQGSPDHFSIYLQNNGWSKYQILFYVLFFSILLFGISIFLVLNMLSIEALFVFFIFLILFWYSCLIIKIS